MEKRPFTLPKTIRRCRFDRSTSLGDLQLHEEPQPQPQRGELTVHAVSLILPRYRDADWEIRSSGETGAGIHE